MDIEISQLKKINDSKNINYSSKANKIEDNLEKNGLNMISEYNFFCENNIKINELIKKITNYREYFITIQNIYNIKMQDDNGVLERNEKIISIKYDLDSFNHFLNFFKTLPSKKLFIYHLIDSYHHLLNGLNILSKNNIDLFDLNNNNIIFDKTLKPKILNYELALNNNITEKQFISILNKCNNFTLKPIEIHFLFYIYNNDIKFISIPFIIEIIDNFMEKILFFDLFSSKYKEQYRQECINYLNNYVNKPKEYIFNDVIRYKRTWSNYSLSLIYLYVIGNTIKTLKIKNTILNKMLLILNKNINPNPNKRENIENTIEKTGILFGEYNNWNFIQDIKDIDYIKLIKSL